VALTIEEYGLLEDFSVLFSGGLDSTAVPLMIGPHTRGDVHLLTYMHRYGSLFNEWSRHQIEPLRRALGPRVYHQLIDHTHTWRAISAARLVRDAVKYRGHYVCCLGCQSAMMTETIAYSIERNITNTFICSSVGGEYAVMSMPMTRICKAEFYKRFGIRYNSPLLDLGVRKVEERVVAKEADLLPGWGKRRSHNGHQPICLLGFQHSLDVVADVHTTYNPAHIKRFLEDKFPVMERLIRERLAQRGFDPDELIERNLATYQREQDRIEAHRATQGVQLPAGAV
jgi:hypothetical protein